MPEGMASDTSLAASQASNRIDFESHRLYEQPNQPVGFLESVDLASVVQHLESAVVLLADQESTAVHESEDLGLLAVHIVADDYTVHLPRDHATVETALDDLAVDLSEELHLEVPVVPFLP